ncbi:MAG: RnfABCDGE type electron transport complex subunit G [Candidatus Omnitrophota bacterium]
MKDIIRYSLTLGLICIVASASLAAVNSLAQPKINEQAKSEEEASLKDVLPEADHFEAVKQGSDILYYKAFDKSGQLRGVAFKVAGKGYSSTIETMAAMSAEGDILAIKVLSQNETPGLGARVTEPDFAAKFSQKSIDGLTEVEAITGATISSRAVIDSVAEKAREVLELIKDEQ